MTDAEPTPGRHREIPGKRIGSGMVFADDAGDILLVKPTYKDGWEIPGGLVEANESPRAAAEREVAEELGITLRAGPLLVVDWVVPQPPHSDSLMFLFDGGRLDADAIAEIRLPPAELAEARFADAVDLPHFLPVHMARRIAAALVARARGTTLDLEDGHIRGPLAGNRRE